MSPKASTTVPIRALIWLMIFTCTFVLYVLRTNMSLIILAMANTDKNSSSASPPQCKASDPSYNETSEKPLSFKAEATYDWDAKLQGLILGAYFWGFVPSQIPAGAISERFGPRRCIIVSFGASALFTLLGPLCASVHPYLLIASRFFVGLFGGVVYPAIHCLISKWAPPEEKGKFISATLGGSLGTVICWPLLGSILENLSWEWGFYVSGILTLSWGALWLLLVHDSPEEHPWIGLEEKTLIVSSLSGTVSSEKRMPPYKSIGLSRAAWALCVAQFGNLWGLFFLMTAGPNFMSSVLGFDLQHTGFLAALPYLARMISGFAFGGVGDLLVRRGVMGKTALRKTFIIASHLVPGLFLIGQTFVGCHATWVIALITLSLASNGASTITNLSNAQDLAPNFAGSLYGIANCIGSASGFISPILVGYMTAQHNGLEEWHTIFYIGAAVYIGCGLFFMAFGSGEIQPWNYSPSRKEGLDNKAFDEDKSDSKA